MNCPKQDACANYGRKCFECGVMSDVQNNHPFFVDRRTMIDRVGMVLANGFDECIPIDRAYTFSDFTQLVKYLVDHGVVVKE